MAAPESQGWAWRDPGPQWQHAGASERSFKLAWAHMLALRDQPAALAGLLSRGHEPNFVPLYRFYLEHYLEARWHEPQCSRCNDASQITEMAGDLLWMLVEQGRLNEPEAWLRAVVRDKLPGADARARLAFLPAYRGWLEARMGAESAREVVQPLVEEAIAAAREHGEPWALDRWGRFWRGVAPRPPA